MIDAIQSVIDGLDAVASDMERTWGVGRLRLLVDDETRLKFDRQKQKLDDAIRAGELAEVRTHADAMRRGWKVLDQLARQAGRKPIAPEVWEVRVGDGRVIAFVRDYADAHRIVADKRHVEVWTAEEIARLVAAAPEVVKAKQVFPGALIESVRPASVSPPIDWSKGDEIPW